MGQKKKRQRVDPNSGNTDPGEQKKKRQRVKDFPNIHKGHGQYAHIGGQTYERDLLNYADTHKKHDLGLSHVKWLWKQANDGNKVTETEKNTLKFIVRNYNLKEDARTFLKSQLQDDSESESDDSDSDRSELASAPSFKKPKL